MDLWYYSQSYTKCFVSQLIAEVERLKKINMLDKLSTFSTMHTLHRHDLILEASKMKKGASELIECIGKSSNIDINSK
jgi:hypothetical protein